MTPRLDAGRDPQVIAHTIIYIYIYIYIYYVARHHDVAAHAGERVGEAEVVGAHPDGVEGVLGGDYMQNYI